MRLESEESKIGFYFFLFFQSQVCDGILFQILRIANFRQTKVQWRIETEIFCRQSEGPNRHLLSSGKSCSESSIQMGIQWFNSGLHSEGKNFNSRVIDCYCLCLQKEEK